MSCSLWLPFCSQYARGAPAADPFPSSVVSSPDSWLECDLLPVLSFSPDPRELLLGPLVFCWGGGPRRPAPVAPGQCVVVPAIARFTGRLGRTSLGGIVLFGSGLCLRVVAVVADVIVVVEGTRTPRQLLLPRYLLPFPAASLSLTEPETCLLPVSAVCRLPPSRIVSGAHVCWQSAHHPSPTGSTPRCSCLRRARHHSRGGVSPGPVMEYGDAVAGSVCFRTVKEEEILGIPGVTWDLGLRTHSESINA